MGFIGMHNANEYKDFICSYYVLKSLLDSLLTLRTWSSVRLSTRSSRDSRRETRLSREPTQSSGRTQLYLSKWSSRDSRRETKLSREPTQSSGRTRECTAVLKQLVIQALKEGNKALERANSVFR